VRRTFIDRPGGRAFTIVELLVVIVIIVILASILLPLVTKARAHAKGVICSNNVHQLMAGFLSFAADHDGQLPGSKNNNGDPNPDHRDWLAAGVPQSAPQGGTIYKYVKNPDAYRCPVIEVETFASGGGTNDHFDYAAFCIWAGAPLRTIPGTAKLQMPDGSLKDFPTPIIVQEDPKSINGGNIEGGHSNTDQISHIHNGGSYYAAPDGSVTWINEPQSDNCNTWYTVGPSSHKQINMGSDLGYGQWTSQ
jgi:prepilin-type N-terminal cleavage/methylation domain-containing protein